MSAEEKKESVSSNIFNIKLTPEEIVTLSRYVKPHDKISRSVEQKDLLRVAEEAKILYELCYLPIGRYVGGEAVAHPQIDDQDPLAFFVLKNKKIIINPNIINHTNTPIDKPEGCLSYPDLAMITVPRWNKVTILYQTFNDEGGLSDWIQENVNGKLSEIYQHECDHLAAHYIY